jgi:hypothetical protein
MNTMTSPMMAATANPTGGKATNPLPVYLGTILLERNRHRNNRVPTYRVSEWLARFAEAGFDGIELWENHALLADEQEVEAIASAANLIPLPVSVFNTYAGFHDEQQPQRDKAIELIRRLRAPAAKFNFSNDVSRRDEQLRNVRAFAEALPGVRLLCECHAGTIAETPVAASELLDALGPSQRFGAIVHVANTPVLDEWIAAMGPRLVHAHAYLPPPSEEAERELADRVALMLRHGFRGSFTLEFTEGMNPPDETWEKMWNGALRDRRRLLDAIIAAQAGASS